MKRLEFEIDGVKQTGFAQLIDDKLWVHTNGRTFSISPQSTSRSTVRTAGEKPGQKSGQKTDKIVSPMPGKITKILVNPGDLVKEKQSLILLEAMKMEYSLKSQINGVVEKIFCSVGDQVALGSTLVNIERTK